MRKIKIEIMKMPLLQENEKNCLERVTLLTNTSRMSDKMIHITHKKGVQISFLKIFTVTKIFKIFKKFEKCSSAAKILALLSKDQF